MNADEEIPWAWICKRLRSPKIDCKESIPPAYVAWRAGTTTLGIDSWAPWTFKNRALDDGTGPTPPPHFRSVYTWLRDTCSTLHQQLPRMILISILFYRVGFARIKMFVFSREKYKYWSISVTFPSIHCMERISHIQYILCHYKDKRMVKREIFFYERETKIEYYVDKIFPVTCTFRSIYSQYVPIFTWFS